MVEEVVQEGVAWRRVQCRGGTPWRSGGMDEAVRQEIGGVREDGRLERRRRPNILA